MSRAIAGGILHDRRQRRQLITGCLLLSLLLLGGGVWPLNEWLMRGVWRFFVYWGVTALCCCFLALLGLYDALAVVREEREKLGLNHPPLTGLEDDDLSS